MNKKKLITMLTALALVGAIGVGATLAYLSDKTAELTNTFKFAENGIGIELDEAKIGDDNKALPAGEDGEEPRVDAGETQEYKNIIPGMIMDKDPTVTITADSLNCNVFVSVKNANAEAVLKINDLNEKAWLVVNPSTYGLKAAANTTYYVYQGEKATGTIESGDTFKVVSTKAFNEDGEEISVDVKLEDVFQTLTVGTDVKQVLDEEGNDITFSAIVIKAAAVQADSCSDDDAAKTALEMLINADAE